MNRFTRFLVLAASGLLLTACGGKEAPIPEAAPTEPTTAPAAAEPAAEVPAADEEPSEEEVPVTADFEEAAETEIGEENYVAELDKLQTELDELEAVMAGDEPAIE